MSFATYIPKIIHVAHLTALKRSITYLPLRTAHQRLPAATMPSKKSKKQARITLNSDSHGSGRAGFGCFLGANLSLIGAS
jgi:histidinol phosphatase-like PHP family hydrolase